jgi:hypothetical protein
VGAPKWLYVHTVAARAGAGSCLPCRMAGSALKQVATEMAGRLALVKVAIGQAPELSERFAARARPGGRRPRRLVSAPRRSR